MVLLLSLLVAYWIWLGFSEEFGNLGFEAYAIQFGRQCQQESRTYLLESRMPSLDVCRSFREAHKVRTPGISWRASNLDGLWRCYRFASVAREQWTSPRLMSVLFRRIAFQSSWYSAGNVCDGRRDKDRSKSQCVQIPAKIEKTSRGDTRSSASLIIDDDASSLFWCAEDRGAFQGRTSLV